MEKEMTIDIDSNIVANLVGQYQNINAELVDIVDSTKMPNVPASLNEYLDIASNLNEIMYTLQDSEKGISDHLTNVKQTLEKTINIIRQNDDFNYFDILDANMLNLELSKITSFEKTIVERKSEISNYINAYESLYTELANEFIQLYGHGVEFDTRKAYDLLKLYEALGVYDMMMHDRNVDVYIGMDGMYSRYEYVLEDVTDSKFANGYLPLYTLDRTYRVKAVLSDEPGFRFTPGIDGGGVCETQYLNPIALKTMFDYCDEKGITKSLKSYINDGKSWKESGLEDLCGESLREWKTTTSSVNLLESEFDSMFGKDSEKVDTELLFIYRYLFPDGSILNSDSITANDNYLDYLNFYEFAKENSTLEYNDDFNNWIEFANGRGAFLPLSYDDRDNFVGGFKDFLSEKNLFDNGDGTSVYSQLKDKVDDSNSKLGELNAISGQIYCCERYYDLIDFEYDKSIYSENYSGYLNYYYNVSSDPRRKLGVYSFLSDEDAALLMYYEDHDPRKAIEYRKALEDSINNAIGLKAAAEWVEHLSDLTDEERATAWSQLWAQGEAYLTGKRDGVITFCDGCTAWFSDCKIISADEYRMMYIMKFLSEESEYTKSMDDITRFTLRNSYSVGSSVGNMEIPMLTRVIGDYICPGFGEISSTALMALSSGGNSYKEARRSGASAAQSYTYGIFSGIEAATFEKFLGKLMPLTPGATTSAVQSGFIRSMLGSMLDEAKEEFLETYVQAALKSAILGEPFDLTDVTGEALYSSIMAVQTAGIINGRSFVTVKIGNNIVNWNCQENLELDESIAAKMGIKLEEGDKFIFNPMNNNYQIIGIDGVTTNVDVNGIKYEGSIVSPEADSPTYKKFVELKDDVKSIRPNSDGTYTVTLVSGINMTVDQASLNSTDFTNMVEFRNSMGSDVSDVQSNADGTYTIKLSSGVELTVDQATLDSATLVDVAKFRNSMGTDVSDVQVNTDGTYKVTLNSGIELTVDQSSIVSYDSVKSLVVSGEVASIVKSGDTYTVRTSNGVELTYGEGVISSENVLYDVHVHNELQAKLIASGSSSVKLTQADLESLNINAIVGRPSTTAPRVFLYYVNDANGPHFVRQSSNPSIPPVNLDFDTVLYGKNRFTQNADGNYVDKVTGYTEPSLKYFDSTSLEHLFHGELAYNRGAPSGGKGGHDINQTNIVYTPDVMENLIVYDNGVIAITTDYDMRIVDSNGVLQTVPRQIKDGDMATFFPRSWSENDIKGAIYATTQTVPYSVQANGNYIYRSNCNGVLVEVIVDSSGSITTAYPLAPGSGIATGGRFNMLDENFVPTSVTPRSDYTVR